MEVKTQVHEAVLDQVRPGLPATVRVDAFPDQVYPAVVDKVAVVPTSDRGWMSAGNVKTYETVVRLVNDVEDLKPGMTAVVNIHVDKVENVLAVPVQAIVQADRETWCYVDAGNGVKRREVKIGRSNDKFVHIQKGLKSGERVVLNSMDIFDEQERETNEISPESGVPELPESVAAVGYDAPVERPAGGNDRAQRGPRGLAGAEANSATGGGPDAAARFQGRRPRDAGQAGGNLSDGPRRRGPGQPGSFGPPRDGSNRGRPEGGRPARGRPGAGEADGGNATENP